MVVPRGARVRTFPTSQRAVVREAEWMVMTQRVANELKPLLKLAREQGWKVSSGADNSKLVWRGPNGEGPVYTSYRCQGRDLLNFRAELIRNGLKLDEETAREHITDTEIARQLDQGEEISGEELQELINKLQSSLSTIMAKSMIFDDIKKQAEEWKELAEAALEDAERYKAQAQEASVMVDAIRACFSMSAWAILPEIAKLLGIDANAPGTPSLADQATKGRTAP